MMKGYAGTILRVDLSRGAIAKEPLREEWALRWVGGVGFGAKFLLDELDKSVDPLDPGNVLVLATGPMTGTGAPTGCSWYTVFKSPLGIYGEGRGGGFWGSELKFAGYDAIVLTGRAEKPVYLRISTDAVELLDAGHLWGKDCCATTDMIQEICGDRGVKVLSIGPAGERLVKFSMIMAEKFRAAGRGGAGAVMGAKNLKAVAVRGTRRVEVADEHRFRGLVREYNELLRKDPRNQRRKAYGTPGGVEGSNALGLLMTRNGQSNTFESADEIGGMKMHETIMSKGRACHACVIGCTRRTFVEEGPYAPVDSEGPEFETIAAFGARCGIADREAIAQANMKCNLYGLDTMSTGAVISFAMECFENGILSKDVVGGLDLRFGNQRAMVSLVDMIACRQGIGDLLAEGVRSAAERLGEEAKRYALHTKGLELPGLDPRGAQDRGLVYAVSNRGADHMRPFTGGFTAAGARCTELGIDEVVDPSIPEGKARLIEKLRCLTTFTNLNGMCMFAVSRFMLGPSHLAELYQAVTGVEYGADDVMRAGARIWTLQRVLNNHFGITRKDDTLPERFLTEAAGGRVVQLKTMLDDYYQIEGWDEDGRPTEARLRDVGLEDLLRPHVG